MQDLVDSYAAQHPTNMSRRNRQSVAVHLRSLCGRQERDMPAPSRRQSLATWARREYPALHPPPVAFAVTAAAVARADRAERRGLVAAMAVSTWEPWAVHHDTVRGFLDEALG